MVKRKKKTRKLSEEHKKKISEGVRRAAEEKRAIRERLDRYDIFFAKFLLDHKMIDEEEYERKIDNMIRLKWPIINPTIYDYEYESEEDAYESDYVYCRFNFTLPVSYLTYELVKEIYELFDIKENGRMLMYPEGYECTFEINNPDFTNIDILSSFMKL